MYVPSTTQSFPNPYGTIDQDSKKVLWNMHQTLREDPCRRFTYGFTIENRTMRIWFCSRAEILVSRPFDFIAVRPTIFS